jgi:hypothetical protein
VDYKSGPRISNPGDLLGGRQIQLPIYALAARKMLLSMGVYHVEAQYYHISTQGGFKRKRLSSDELPAMEGRLKEIVAIIVQGISSGLFIPAGEKETCQFCECKAACGSVRGAVPLRKKDDPALESFHRMRDIRTA